MFKFSEFSNTNNLLGNSNNKEFIKLLQTKWEELHNEADIFRYKLDNLQERKMDGYLLQLNPNRSSQRRSPEQINHICQPFDANKFNFTKVSPREIMFNIVKEGNDADVHTLLINVSPISRYHSLLCPSMLKGLPQVVTEESLALTLEIMFLAEDRDLRIGFNSLCAMASVNHLHYHLFLESNTLPVETAKCKHIKGSLYCLDDYIAPAFCFVVPTQQSITPIAKDFFKLLAYFLKNSIAHNIFISRGENVLGDDKKEVVRVLVWPRKTSVGVKQLAAFNVAVCELSGWFPVYNKEDYENLITADLEVELRKWKMDNFEKLCEEVKLLY